MAKQKTAPKKSPGKADKKSVKAIATGQPVPAVAVSADSEAKAKAKPKTKSSTKAKTKAKQNLKPVAKVKAKTEAKTKQKKSAETPPATKKAKLVRDSFTIPKLEYQILDTLKKRAASLQRPVKKSELLRAGIAALDRMQADELLAALNAVPSIKTGRPPK